jgi:biopolymer transport protein ExbB
VDTINLLALAQEAAAVDAAEVGVNSVWDFVVKGGLMMVPIAICSLVIVTVSVERSVVLRKKQVMPEGFSAGLDPLLDRGVSGKQEAINYCEQSNSPIGRTLLGGVERIGRPMESVEKHMVAAGEHEIFMLRRRLRALSVVAAIAPLLGLVGTIFGMIKAFQTVAVSADALGKTELLAEGIYEAMITTAAGLVVAIPALVLYHWFSSRIENLTREMDSVCLDSVEAIAKATGHEGEELEEDHSGIVAESFPVRGGAIG